MILNTDLPHNQTSERIEITFCGKGKCKCPSIEMDLNRDKIIIGGEKEGYTEFTKEVEEQKDYQGKVRDALKGLMELRQRKQRIPRK